MLGDFATTAACYAKFAWRDLVRPPAADTQWVGLDGLAPAHDAIRGGFDPVPANVRAAAGRHVCASVTLDTANVGDLRALAEFVAPLRAPGSSA